MDKFSGQKRAAQFLFPSIDPFDSMMLDVGGGHEIYVERCGNPKGKPVIVLHGGPGGGCSPVMRRYFDPKKYHVVLFDQRGCGRSKPQASVKNNTTWDLVGDIELIREKLGISDWMVFGGSWGATLSLIYAQKFPKHVANLLLRGVFLMTKPELEWFYGGGAGQFWPDVWKKFKEPIPTDEQADLIKAYNRRLFSGNLREEMEFGQYWSSWENALASIASDGISTRAPADYARTFARIENHYFINNGFLENKNAILDNMEKIEHIPGNIVQGRFDMICPPTSAFNLVEKWPNAKIKIIPQAGHAMSEPGISSELVKITNELVS